MKLPIALALILLAGCAAGGGPDDATPAPFDSAQASATPPPATATTPIAAVAINCEDGDDALPSVRTERPTTFWADDEALREVVAHALVRLSRATGMPLSVAPGGVLVDYADLPKGMAGFASDHVDVDASKVAPELFETVVVHELGHMLGALHLGPYEGVMSRCIGMGSTTITAADLEQICAAAPCTAFVPETPETP